MQMLTVLPQSWIIHQIQDQFGISNYMARATKKLVEEKGILSIPNPKPGRAISDEVTAKIKEFIGTMISFQTVVLSDYPSLRGWYFVSYLTCREHGAREETMCVCVGF